MLMLEVLHLADDERFALENRQINLGLVPEAADEPFRSVPPGTWLLQNIPWTEAEHAVTAVAADPTTSRRLKIPAGEPCLEIARRTWNGGTLVTYVRILYPADRYRLVGRFTPDAG